MSLLLMLCACDARSAAVRVISVTLRLVAIACETSDAPIYKLSIKGSTKANSTADTPSWLRRKRLRTCDRRDPNAVHIMAAHPNTCRRVESLLIRLIAEGGSRNHQIFPAGHVGQAVSEEIDPHR